MADVSTCIKSSSLPLLTLLPDLCSALPGVGCVRPTVLSAPRDTAELGTGSGCGLQGAGHRGSPFSGLYHLHPPHHRMWTLHNNIHHNIHNNIHHNIHLFTHFFVCFCLHIFYFHFRFHCMRTTFITTFICLHYFPVSFSIPPMCSYLKSSGPLTWTSAIATTWPYSGC